MKARKVLILIGLSAIVAFGACKKDDPIVKTTPYLYYADPSDEVINKLSLDSLYLSTVKDVVEMSGVGLAYDKAKNKMYFADFYDETTPDGKIWKMNLDGTEAVAIVSGLLNPFGIALDLTHGKVYWGDELGNVSRANLDGTGKEIGIVNVVDGLIRAIALDVDNNKMYFYDVQHDELNVANLDGTSSSVLISGVYGYVLYVDTKNDKLYFDDQYGPALKMANLDGTGIVEVDNTDTRIYGVEIDYTTNKLYWTARDAGEIYRANLNGTEKETLVAGLSSPRQLFLTK